MQRSFREFTHVRPCGLVKRSFREFTWVLQRVDETILSRVHMTRVLMLSDTRAVPRCQGCGVWVCVCVCYIHTSVTSVTGMLAYAGPTTARPASLDHPP